MMPILTGLSTTQNQNNNANNINLMNPLNNNILSSNINNIINATQDINIPGTGNNAP
jgi:hypothetical protein